MSENFFMLTLTTKAFKHLLMFTVQTLHKLSEPTNQLSPSNRFFTAEIYTDKKLGLKQIELICMKRYTKGLNSVINTVLTILLLQKVLNIIFVESWSLIQVRHSCHWFSGTEKGWSPCLWRKTEWRKNVALTILKISDRLVLSTGYWNFTDLFSVLSKWQHTRWRKSGFAYEWLFK